jgi:hypothetical protein
MSEFFQDSGGSGGGCSANNDRTVVLCSPSANGNLTSPVEITAAATRNEHAITGMVAYANSQIVARSNGSTLSAGVPLSPGQYQLVIRAWDSTGYYVSSEENSTVK